VHDVAERLYVTGFTRDTGQYFNEGQPCAPRGDYLEFFCRDRPARRAQRLFRAGDCFVEAFADTAAC